MRKTFYDYFGDLQQKYESRISLNRPFVLRLDGKNCTANGMRDLTKPGDGEFSWSMILSAKSMLRKYDGIAYVALDEISFLFSTPEQIYKRVGSNKIQDIIAVLTQEFFQIFNERYTGYKPVYFSANCYSIPSDKVLSYLKYRLTANINTCRVYFSKKRRLTVHKEQKTAKELEAELLKLSEYHSRTVYEKEGALIACGDIYKASDYVDHKHTLLDINTYKIMPPCPEDKNYKNEITTFCPLDF